MVSRRQGHTPRVLRTWFSRGCAQSAARCRKHLQARFIYWTAPSDCGVPKRRVLQGRALFSNTRANCPGADQDRLAQRGQVDGSTGSSLRALIMRQEVDRPPTREGIQPIALSHEPPTPPALPAAHPQPIAPAQSAPTGSASARPSYRTIAASPPSQSLPKSAASRRSRSEEHTSELQSLR